MKIRSAIIIVSAMAFLPAPAIHAEIPYSPLQQQASQGDVLAQDVLQWLEAIQNQNPSFNTIKAVVSKHADWPLQGELKAKADKAIVKGGVSTQDILSWYATHSPGSGSAKLIYLETLFELSQTDKLNPLLKKYWRAGDFDTEKQTIILGQWGSVLSQEDHYARADSLIDQGKFERAEMAIGYVSSMEDKNLFATRLLLLNGSDKAETAYQSLTQAQKDQPSIIYARLHYLRNAQENDAAAVFLSQYQTAPLGYQSQWWRERHILARRALEEKRYDDAYYLAADHGFEKGLPMAEGEWLSGWVALTYLNRADLAFGHFDTMYKKVTTPISKARAGYGAGLASEALGENAIAKRWFEVSGDHVHTFYGQKSLEKLGQKAQVMQVAFQEKSPADQLNAIVPSAGTIRALNDLSAFQAAEILHNAGYEKERDLFLLSLVWKVKDQDQLLDLLNITQAMNSQTAALSISKRLQQEGVDNWNALFPTLNFEIGSAVDPDLTHAIIRQESVFNPNIESRAGAKGLMQLMPTTASEEAVKLGIAHDTAWLFSKPEHNVKLGQSYLKRMLDRYGGSLPLAVAAYNAGPGNVDEWVTTIGDPRVTGDELEWMEKIPFKETRNYVQRVLESYAVYQAK